MNQVSYRSLVAMTIPAFVMATVCVLCLGLPRAGAGGLTYAAGHAAGNPAVTGPTEAAAASPESKPVSHGQVAVSSGELNLSTIAPSAYGDRSGPIRFSQR